MKYPDGRLARLNDRVHLANGEYGTIVFSADTDEYSDDYAKDNWAHIKKGVMIRTDNGALVQYEDPNTNFAVLVDPENGRAT